MTRFLQQLNAIALALILVVASIPAVAQVQQQPGANDPGFNAADIITGAEGINGSVLATAVQADGKVLVVGGFTSYNGKDRRYIFRLHADGTSDDGYSQGIGFNNSVSAIVLQPDGKAVVGGGFTAYNGVTRNYIARLLADGSLDPEFVIGAGFNGGVLNIALQPDGNILVGGSFTTYNGSPCSSIARLHADGSLDASFDTGSGFDATVSALTLQSDGRILVGGHFKTFNGTARSHIARLNSDGSLDATFNPGTGFDLPVLTLVMQAEGKIVAGGHFNAYNGIASKNIIQLNTNGTADPSFQVGSGFNGSVYVIRRQGDGRLVAAGGFNSYQGQPNGYIIRLHPDGSADASFSTVGSGFIGGVYTISLQQDNKLIVGGSFNAFNERSRSRLARLHIDGSLEEAFHISSTGFLGSVYALAVQPDGKIVVGGRFDSFNTVACNYIVRLHADGSLDTSFNPGSGFNNYVETIALQSDGKIVVGGYFTSYNDISRNRIVRLHADGSIDTNFNPGTGFLGAVLSIAIQADGKIVAGGNFSSFNGTARARIARLNTNGTLDVSFNVGTGFNNNVRAIARQHDGNLLLAGDFTAFNGNPYFRIIRLNADGSPDDLFYTGTGFNAGVYTLALQPNGKIIAGGGFSSYNNAAFNKLIRLNNNGSPDDSFHAGAQSDGDVTATALQTNGKIIIGGSFSIYDGVAHSKITRLNADGTPDTTFDPEAGFNHNIRSLAMQSNDKVIVGGDFTAHNNIPRNRIARLFADEGTSLSVANGLKGKLTIFLFPNPTQGDINLEFSGAAAMEAAAALKLYNAMGKQVLTKEITANEAQAGVKIQTTGLASGIYFLSISTRSGVVTKRVVLAE